MTAQRTKARWPARALRGRSASMPAFDHPALATGRTLYPHTVRPADAGDRWALKSGSNNWKIGAQVLKGKWKYFPVFTLTLEERRTCPTTCHHWRSCFGNHMHLADRVQAGPALEWRLQLEAALLEMQFPTGFAVRLHVLGDFYSVQYVELWRTLLERHPALRVFGFSARWDVTNDPIAAALVALTETQWDRFALRFSNAPLPSATPATISVEHPFQVPPDAILCPQEIGKTESCSTCGLCWQSKRRIAFLQH